MAKTSADSSAPPSQLVFDIPGAEVPGFLRRQRIAMLHLENLRTQGGLQTMDEMITFLLTFVSAPTDREHARELLLDLSRADYRKLLNAILQENDDFLPSAPPSSAS